MKKLYFMTILWITSIFRSVRDFRSIHLMDYVVYDGKLLFVNNGRSCPKWDLLSINWNPDGTRTGYLIHQDEFRKLFWRNLKHDLFFIHKWYMTSWFSLDLREKLKGGE